MKYDLSPIIFRSTVYPEPKPGGSVASFDISFGPISICAKLFPSSSGFFLSWPSLRSETGKWHDQVQIADPALRLKAQDLAIEAYQNAKKAAAK